MQLFSLLAIRKRVMKHFIGQRKLVKHGGGSVMASAYVAAYSSVVEVGQRSSKIILLVVGPNLLRCVLAVVLCFAVSS